MPQSASPTVCHEGGGFEALVHGAGLKDGTPGAGPGGENQKMA